jgi:hypothetical protein
LYLLETVIGIAFEQVEGLISRFFCYKERNFDILCAIRIKGAVPLGIAEFIVPLTQQPRNDTEIRYPIFSNTQFTGKWPLLL